MGLAALVLALALSPAAGLALQQPPRPVALKDAVVHPAGERATVLLRDGLVEAVGPDLAIPAGVDVVDAKGLHVYPAFLDARTTLGLPETKRSPEARRRAEGEKPDFAEDALPRMEQANRKGLRPDFDAAPLLEVSDDALKKAHAGGFAYAMSAGQEEYLAGRGVLHALSGAPARNAVIRAPAAHFGGFGSYGDGYPGTTMGVLAHLRQVFLDARHHASARRPAADPALDALLPLLRREAVLHLQADGEREILRAVELAKEFDLRLRIVGGAEAGRVADVLEAQGVEVILRLRVPKEPPKRLVAEDVPAKLKAERERLREEELDAALRLHRAGVPFAFCTFQQEGDVLTALRRRIERGLPADAALAAISAVPARLFGLAHGVEPGRPASLTILSAPLGDPKAAVKMVFADGRRFDVDGKAAEDKKKDEEKPDPKAPPPILTDADVELDAGRAPKSPGASFVLKNAVLLTASPAGTIEGGSIVVRDGKIVAVGRDLAVPDDLPAIDGAGLFAIPGIVDAHSHIAAEGGLNEGTQSVTPEVRMADVLDGGDVAIWRALAGGVTTANVLHGSANAIGGQSAVIKLKPGARPSDLLFAGAPRSVKFALGENPKQANFPANRGKRFPNTRMGVEAAIRRSLAEAADYARRRREDPAVRRDLRLEALADILEGEVRIHCHSYRADEILMILQVAKDHRLRLATLQHVLEGYKVGPEIAALGAGASTFSDWWAYKFEVWDAIPHNAALMTRQGVLVSVNSDSPEQIRHLNVEAAKTMKYGGLTEAEALATITINPARQLGLGSRIGSIEAGKEADLALFNGHPFSPYSRCVATAVDGVLRFDARGAAGNPTPAFKPSERKRLAPLPLPTSPRIAIANARIHPVSAEPFTGTIVVADGKIAAMGVDVSPPAGVEVIDAKGLSVYPGLVSALSTLGLTEIGSIAGSVDIAEIGGVQPDLKALTAVNPHSELIPVARSNGITSVLVAPQAGTIAGESALIRLDGWTPSEMAVRDAVALHVNYPDLAGTEDHKAGDERKLKALRTPFEDAKRYTGIPRDLGLEAMQPYVKGARPVVFHAQKASQIRGSLALAKELGLKPIIAGGLESWKVAPLLAEAGAPVIFGGVMTLPLAEHDPYDSTFSAPARLAKAGVPFAFSSSVEEWHGNSRNLPYHAAWAAAYGLDRRLALEAVTLAPARILGAADRIGSLEVGKDADLIVTTGDPLEVLTDVVLVLIRGRAQSLETRQTRLYDKFRSRPK